MRGEESAYAVLGLRPGAGRATVDEAYRRLIKRHHPDRTGGDGSRAAEINRAYTQIRRQIGEPPRPRRPVAVRKQASKPPARRRRAAWMLATALVVLVTAGIAYDVPVGSSNRFRSADPFEWPTQDYGAPVTVAAVSRADFEEPLQTAVIDRAIADAMRFHAERDPAAMFEFSRSCHNRLRADPSLTWFDSCTAFDEAVVIVTGADPLEDSGPFNASSVMARQMGAARMLSDDLPAADSRLRQIRSRVELTILPLLDEAAASLP